MFIESLIHLSGIRLTNVTYKWPADALVYARFMTQLYGLLALFVSIVLFFISQRVEKNIMLIKAVAAYAILHGLYLFSQFFQINFLKTFAQDPSVILVGSFYQPLILLEGLLLLGFGIFTISATFKRK